MFQLMHGYVGYWVRIRDGVDILAVTTNLRKTKEEALHDAIRTADLVEDDTIETPDTVTITYYETEDTSDGGKQIKIKRKTEKKL